MSSLAELQRLGQSIWLDGVPRQLLASGQIGGLIERDGVSGVIGDLAAMQQEITAGAYDRSIAGLVERSPDIDSCAMLERLALEDVELASDLLRAGYERSQSGDGFVAFDLSPQVAYDTARTIAEARRLSTSLARANVMVKIPATTEGVAAIEQLVADGIPVNATLIFSVSQYEQVAEACARGLARTSRPQSVHAVASFPVAQLDTAVDRALEEVANEEALGLKRKAAIATAKLAYLRFRQIFEDRRFARSQQGSMRLGRPLWVTAGSPREGASGLMYVEALIGPETVSAMSLETLAAFRSRGRAQPVLGTGEERAEEVLGVLSKLGISLKSVGEELTEAGVERLEKSYDETVAALDRRRAALKSQPAA